MINIFERLKKVTGSLQQTITKMDACLDSEGSTLPASSPKKSASIASSINGSKSNKIKSSKSIFPRDAFVFHNADTGIHHCRFRILPYSRVLNSNYSEDSDKLFQSIKNGGGMVVDGKEGELSPTDSHDVIKILDLEYVRANINETQSMILPYDCFSSSFIWNQIYQRSNSDVEKRNADLNMYRVSPSALQDFDANGILYGTKTWNDIEPISSEKLSPAVCIKEVALQFFPELLVWPNGRTRRIYTRHDSQELLDKICEIGGHGRVLGIGLYKELSQDYLLDRTSLSLKEHFRKTILPHLLANDGYYSIAQEDLVKFQRIVNKEERMKLRNAKKRARETDMEEIEDE